MHRIHTHAHTHKHTGLVGCGIPQAIIQQPSIPVHTALITAQSQSKSCTIFGGQSGNVKSFSLCSFVSACQYLSTNFPHHLTSLFKELSCCAIKVARLK